MAGKGLVHPPYKVSSGLAPGDGLAPDSIDSILAPNGTDDVLGEQNLVPAAPYGSGEAAGGAPPPNQKPISADQNK